MSEPRRDDQTDQFAYDPANPPPSLMLTRSPYPGPGRVYLTTITEGRTPLGSDEVQWDPNGCHYVKLFDPAIHDPIT